MDLPRLTRRRRGHYVYRPRGTKHEGSVFIILYSPQEPKDRRWRLDLVPEGEDLRTIAYRPFCIDIRLALHRYLAGNTVPETPTYVRR